MNFKELDNGHEKDQKDCGACWTGYPMRHECGGLMHAEHFEESWDGYSLMVVCDKCDEKD